MPESDKSSRIRKWVPVLRKRLGFDKGRDEGFDEAAIVGEIIPGAAEVQVA